MSKPLSEAMLAALRGMALGRPCPKRQKLGLGRKGLARFYLARDPLTLERTYTEEVMPLGREALRWYEGTEVGLVVPTLDDARASARRPGESFSIRTLTLWVAVHSGRYPRDEGWPVARRNAMYGRLEALVRKTVGQWQKAGHLILVKASYFEPGVGRQPAEYQVRESIDETSGPHSFPVTDPYDDAPDGAVVDGYERHGSTWEKSDGVEVEDDLEGWETAPLAQDIENARKQREKK